MNPDTFKKEQPKKEQPKKSENQNLSLKEIIKKRNELQSKIANLITEFQEENSVVIDIVEGRQVGIFASGTILFDISLRSMKNIKETK